MEQDSCSPARAGAGWESALCAIAPKSSGRPWICRARSITAHRLAAFLMSEPTHNKDQTEAASLAKDSADHSSTDKKRVFLVDDHTMFREGLRQLIEREPGLVVCGDAPDAAEALRGIRTSKPDVVVVD